MDKITSLIRAIRYEKQFELLFDEIERCLVHLTGAIVAESFSFFDDFRASLSAEAIDRKKAFASISRFQV